MVPCFRIFRTRLDGLFEIDPRVCERILSKIECAEVVIRFGVGGLGGNDLLEGPSCLVKIATLKKRDPIGEVIAPETALMKRSGKRKSFLKPFLVILRDIPQVFL